MRTTESAVRSLAGIKDTVDVTAFIATANVIVDKVAACSSSATDTSLELIERYLAAHYAYSSGVKTNMTVASKSIGRASESYSRMGAGSNTRSPYLQTAMDLDTDRCLIGLLEGQISIQWLGTER